MGRSRDFLGGAGLGLIALITPGLPAQAEVEAAKDAPRYHHVLLISVDGLHAVDLRNYVGTHPVSTLAFLTSHGFHYPSALSSAPSDSFPGLLAQVTGGTSKSHGVFYDVSYDRKLFAPRSNCKGNPGTQPAYAENLDKDPTSFTGGGTLGLPLTQIDATKLPLALVAGKCKPVFPHQFVKVNTIFEVIRRHGCHTAWADKHPAYDLGTKLAEHGGFAHDDRNVALLVSNPSLPAKIFSAPVETRQIAPTILEVLGFEPDELQAVVKENTKVLPGFH